MRALLFSLLGLAAAASTQERREKIEGLQAAKFVTDEQLPFLCGALDLEQTGEWRALYAAMDNSTRLRGRRAVVASLAARACAETPTFVIVEDLHWADGPLLGHLAALAAAMADGPGLLLLTSRIEGDPIDAAWRASCRGISFATLDIGPLRSEEAFSLAGGFIDATQRVARACIERAGGNPLFLEQLLRHTQEGTADAIPPSIHSLVLARMDRLQARDRQAFQAAAVIGQRFDLALQRHLIGDTQYVCDRLVAHALVLPEGDDFLFAHALIQEGAYASLLRSTRKTLHLKSANWYEGKDPLLRAQHLDRAEDERRQAPISRPRWPSAPPSGSRRRSDRPSAAWRSRAQTQTAMNSCASAAISSVTSAISAVRSPPTAPPSPRLATDRCDVGRNSALQRVFA